ncbi:hypothetical protein PQX77_015113 [Marasmius sp. AFHP31]|nr:hypothetical protein PQX77_022171 [Marasmius sp. AFHP31]KAK1222082.1 hypothetical protein PQX77_015113 [Marasmius sp. AFHP31]
MSGLFVAQGTSSCGVRSATKPTDIVSCRTNAIKLSHKAANDERQTRQRFVFLLQPQVNDERRSRSTIGCQRQTTNPFNDSTTRRPTTNAKRGQTSVNDKPRATNRFHLVLHCRPPSLLPATMPRSRDLNKKYQRRLQQPISRADRPGKLYAILGWLKGKPFVKVGRSIDFERRFREHQRSCRDVDWERGGVYHAANCHRAEALVHIDLEREGFIRFRGKCSCRKRHSERFVLPGKKIREALNKATIVIRAHKTV